ncbi:sigma-54 interaction domain-containing protein [Desulfovibrio sp.]
MPRTTAKPRAKAPARGGAEADTLQLTTQAALRMYRADPGEHEDLCGYVLRQLMDCTGSTVGYLAAPSPLGEEGVVMVLAEQPAERKSRLIRLQDLGPWGDEASEEQFAVVNDCRRWARGGERPAWAGSLSRHLGITLRVDGEGVWYCGLGNKNSSYVRRDAMLALELLRDAWWARTLGEAWLDRHRAHQELTNYQNQLLAIFNSIVDGMLTVDLDMRILSCNEAFQRMTCMGEAQARGRSIVEILPADPNPFAEVLRQTFELGRAVRDFQTDFVFADDTGPRRLEINATPLVNSAHEFCGGVLVIKDISRLVRLEHERKRLRSYGKMIGNSQRMLEVFSMIESLEGIMSTVLITGESGTGKELVAECLHYNSPRSDKPFICVNCSALTENLIESELFGHVRGAFTGAVSDRVGRVQAAEGGVLFLDEIDDIPLSVQLKLLRFLETKQFERVGETRSRHADVRIIAATNAKLCEKIRRGAFREDLYYRLNVIKITMPPLRERSGDIPLLVDHFVGLFSSMFEKDVHVVTPNAMKQLLSYRWPGNVRELKHSIEHAVAVCNGGVIHAKDLPESLLEPAAAQPSPDGAGADFSSRKPSREDLRRALERYGCKKAHIARALGVSRTTLYRWLREYNL